MAKFHVRLLKVPKKTQNISASFWLDQLEPKSSLRTTNYALERRVPNCVEPAPFPQDYQPESCRSPRVTTAAGTALVTRGRKRTLGIRVQEPSKRRPQLGQRGGRLPAGPLLSLPTPSRPHRPIATLLCPAFLPWSHSIWNWELSHLWKSEMPLCFSRSKPQGTEGKKSYH